MKPLLVVVIASVVCSPPALAQKTILDGNNLDDNCRYSRMLNNGVKLSEEQFAKVTFCLGYIRGVLDEMWLEQEKGDASKVCMSNDISNDQAEKVILKYLQDNPAKLHLPASFLIRVCLEDAFPCKAHN